jgi:hypothetical protein
MFFDLNDLAPAPRIQTENNAARVAFPRTGDARVEIALGGDGLSIGVHMETGGPGYSAADAGWQRLQVAGADDYVAARAWTQSAAKSVLPARR